jgi:glutamate synthase (NADPH/NADH) large chain
MQRPRVIQDALVKTNREAYANYSDEQLSALLADKRLTDYKTALAQRDVQSIYSIGATAWIIEQDKINKQALTDVINVEQYIAELASSNIVQAMLDE